MNKKGFTLIELLVVVAIIGVLATVVLGSLATVREKAKYTKRKMLLNQLEIALELYYGDHMEYPRATASYGVNNAGSLTNGSGSAAFSSAAIAFENDIKPYMEIKLSDEIWEYSQWGTFFYKSSSGNNYQTYGVLSATYDADYPEITIGENPDYCMTKYGGRWLPSTSVCADGN